MLSLKALVSTAGGAKHKGLMPISIVVNGKEVKQGEVSQANADMLHVFDVKEHPRSSVNEVTLKIKGEQPRCIRSSVGTSSRGGEKRR
jgi:hypothetical protein